MLAGGVASTVALAGSGGLAAAERDLVPAGPGVAWTALLPVALAAPLVAVFAAALSAGFLVVVLAGLARPEIAAGAVAAPLGEPFAAALAVVLAEDFFTETGLDVFVFARTDGFEDLTAAFRGERVAKDFFRVFLDIRLPFVAFAGS